MRNYPKIFIIENKFTFFLDNSKLHFSYKLTNDFKLQTDFNNITNILALF